ASTRPGECPLPPRVQLGVRREDAMGKRTDTRTVAIPTPSPREGRSLLAGLLLLSGVLALGGCYVAPAGYAYAPPPAPVYVAPAPVYVAPAPVYVWGGYGWSGYGWRRGRW